MSTFLYLCQLKKTHSLEGKRCCNRIKRSQGEAPLEPPKDPPFRRIPGRGRADLPRSCILTRTAPPDTLEKEEEEDPSPYIPAIRRGEPELRQISGLRCPRINFLHSSMVHASLSRAVLPVRSAALSLAQEIIKIDPFATATLRTHKRDPELDFMIAAESLNQP